MQDEVIKGIIDRIIYKNKENGYHVLDVKLLFTNKKCTIVGNHVKLHEGVTMAFTGAWKSNTKFGNQFAASKMEEITPETKEALVKYLSSSFFKGIGPVIAKKIVEYFGDDVLKILKTDSDKLLKVPGISKRKLIAIKQAWELNTEINEIMVFLQTYNISTLFSVKIYEFYGQNCIAQIKENPYRLADDIKGIGFKYSDNIALDLGFAKDSEFRISAGIKYGLTQAETNGHCYLTLEQLIKQTTSLLEVRVKNLISPLLETLITDNEVKKTNLNEEDRYYSVKLFYNERYCANKIDILKSSQNIYDNSLVESWKKERKNDTFQLSEEQLSGVLGVLRGGVSVLTGGPGVGKTTVLKYLVDLLEILKIDYVLAAPTGRASQKLSEVTENQASTIHRLLGWDHIKGSFIHNEENKLNSEFFIIDESSMIDIHLASDLLRAIPDDAQILFLGDVDQLPPVGAGSFFKDLIYSGFVKTFILNKIFRQAQSSNIVKFAHQINQGVEPEIYSPLIDPNIWNTDNDCLFVDSDLFDPYKEKTDYPDWSSLFYEIDAMGMIKRLYVDTIRKFKGKKEIQILSPMNVGDLGTEKINTVIQDAVNPASESKTEITIRQRIFRDGDKIIQIQNNYDLGVFNGDIGKIVHINPDKKGALIEFGSENKQIEYKRDELLEIKLAYAITIHKSQGSEFPVVIIPLINQHYNMLYRNLVYTGLTRAKELCVFVGQRSSLKIASQNIKQTKRQTSLLELLQLRENN